MHFLSFIINLLGWAGVGVFIGFFALKGQVKNQNKTLILTTAGSLFGGLFAFATHGMWVEVGIDFFNFLIAFAFGAGTVYIFVPQSRIAFSELFVNLKDYISSFLSPSPKLEQKLS